MSILCTVGQCFSAEYKFREFKFCELSLPPNQIVLNTNSQSYDSSGVC